MAVVIRKLRVGISVKAYQFFKCVCVLVLVSWQGLALVIADEWSGVSRIVAVGDIHGDYENYRKVLRDAGLINRRGNWVAGDTHFVQLGDLSDRGPDTEKVIGHMKKLQRQANSAGGKVHPLIGNHEAMNMLGDLRYVHPGEYSALRSANSRKLRSDYYDSEVNRLEAVDENFVADKAFRAQWQAEHPLGFVEHRMAWHPTGEFGSWIVQNNAVVKINRTLFLHGGISPELVGTPLREINLAIQEELNGNIGEEKGLSEQDSGPLWYRGLARNSEEIESTHVDAVLDAYDVDRIVVGHTPGHGIILPRFGGKVLVIDTGISEYYGGHLASLLIEDDSYFARQAGQVLVLPGNATEVLPYLEAAATLTDNPTPALQRLLQELR